MKTRISRCVMLWVVLSLIPYVLPAETNHESNDKPQTPRESKKDNNSNDDAVSSDIQDMLDGLDIGDGGTEELMKTVLKGLAASKKKKIPHFKGRDKTSQYKEQLKLLLEKADELKAARKYEQAALFYRIVSTARAQGIDNDKKRATDALVELEKLATDKFTEASDLLIKGNTQDAVLILKFIVDSFGYTKIAPKARSKLSQLMSDDKIAAQVAYIDAKKMDTAGDLLNAIEEYKNIIKDYPTTVAALRAKKRIEKIQNDPELSKRCQQIIQAEADVKAPRILSITRQYLNAAELANNAARQKKLRQRALSRAKEIVEKYPNTRYADTARDIIKKLEKQIKE